MDTKMITFDERYDNEDNETTTFYFVAPKEMLDLYFPAPNWYPDAVSMEIAVEVPTECMESRLAGVSVSPTRNDDGQLSDYDWFDIDMSYEDTDALIKLGINESRMRICDDDVIFDPGIDVDPAWEYGTGVYGYLWATKPLCDIAGYKHTDDDDDYINFYPVCYSDGNKLAVVCSGVQNGVRFDEKIVDLSTSELKLILNRFIEYYFESKKELKEIFERN